MHAKGRGDWENNGGLPIPPKKRGTTRPSLRVKSVRNLGGGEEWGNRYDIFLSRGATAGAVTGRGKAKRGTSVLGSEGSRGTGNLSWSWAESRARGPGLPSHQMKESTWLTERGWGNLQHRKSKKSHSQKPKGRKERRRWSCWG